MMLRSTSLTEGLCLAAAGAGDAILRHYRRDVRVTLKKDRSPLTEADRASHEYLIEALDRLTPGVPVISEESNAESQQVGSMGGPYWLVDPLDGTKEFLKGTDEFTVNIALIEDGYPLVGVVAAPALGLTYIGSRDDGALRRRGNEAPVVIQSCPAASSPLRIVASKDHVGPQVASILARAPDAELRSMGSSLKFCLVAEGSAHLYLRDVPTMEWDTAAAQCVVEAAGGTVCDLQGRRLSYGKPSLRNPSILTLADSKFNWKDLLGYVGENGRP